MAIIKRSQASLGVTGTIVPIVSSAQLKLDLNDITSSADSLLVLIWRNLVSLVSATVDSGECSLTNHNAQ